MQTVWVKPEPQQKKTEYQISGVGRVGPYKYSKSGRFRWRAHQYWEITRFTEDPVEIKQDYDEYYAKRKAEWEEANPGEEYPFLYNIPKREYIRASEIPDNKFKTANAAADALKEWIKQVGGKTSDYTEYHSSERKEVAKEAKKQTWEDYSSLTKTLEQKKIRLKLNIVGTYHNVKQKEQITIATFTKGEWGLEFNPYRIYNSIDSVIKRGYKFKSIEVTNNSGEVLRTYKVDKPIKEESVMREILTKIANKS